MPSHIDLENSFIPLKNYLEYLSNGFRVKYQEAPVLLSLLDPTEKNYNDIQRLAELSNIYSSLITTLGTTTIHDPEKLSQKQQELLLQITKKLEEIRKANYLQLSDITALEGVQTALRKITFENPASQTVRVHLPEMKEVKPDKTELHYACLKRDKDAITLAVRGGAKWDARDGSGKTPLDYLFCNKAEAETVLEEVRAKQPDSEAFNLVNSNFEPDFNFAPLVSALLAKADANFSQNIKTKTENNKLLFNALTPFYEKLYDLATAIGVPLKDLLSSSPDNLYAGDPSIITAMAVYSSIQECYNIANQTTTSLQDPTDIQKENAEKIKNIQAVLTKMQQNPSIKNNKEWMALIAAAFVKLQTLNLPPPAHDKAPTKAMSEQKEASPSSTVRVHLPEMKEVKPDKTELHYACLKRDKDAITIAVRGGARWDARDGSGKTPLDYLFCNKAEAETVLEEVRAKQPDSEAFNLVNSNFEPDFNFAPLVSALLAKADANFSQNIKTKAENNKLLFNALTPFYDKLYTLADNKGVPLKELLSPSKDNPHAKDPTVQAAMRAYSYVQECYNIANKTTTSMQDPTETQRENLEKIKQIQAVLTKMQQDPLINNKEWTDLIVAALTTLNKLAPPVQDKAPEKAPSEQKEVPHSLLLVRAAAENNEECFMKSFLCINRANDRMTQFAATDVHNDNKRTALHYACLHRNITLINRLTQWGASYNVRDKFGKTPLDYLALDQRQASSILIEGVGQEKANAVMKSNTRFSKGDAQTEFGALVKALLRALPEETITESCLKCHEQLQLNKILSQFYNYIEQKAAIANVDLSKLDTELASSFSYKFFQPKNNNVFQLYKHYKLIEQAVLSGKENYAWVSNLLDERTFSKDFDDKDIQKLAQLRTEVANLRPDMENVNSAQPR